MMKNYHFCNNCGKQGHIFGQCKRPITSIGIVACSKRGSDLVYLMICRKDTLGYVDFLRGKYPLYNKSYIQDLINEMTVEEKKRLLSKDFSALWGGLWGNFVGLQYRGEEKASLEKFKQMKRGIQMYSEEDYSLATLIRDSTTNWKTPEWGFPKGRRNYQENDASCAQREWSEETGYSARDLALVKNVIPFEEVFMGSNYKVYKHRYYLGLMETTEPSASGFQESEVSDMRWLTLDECRDAIRPYNLEKITLVEYIDRALHRYRLIS